MTDKKKIKAEIKRRIVFQKECIKNSYRLTGKPEEEIILEYKQLLSFIDSLPEEPVNIDFEQELYKAFGQVKDFTLGMQIAKWFYDMGKNSQEPASIWHDASEKPERENLLIETNNGRIIHRQSINNYGMVKRWAYTSDLLNLSNVQRTIKNWKEPVSEDLEEAAEDCGIRQGAELKPFAIKFFKAGAMWQKQQDQSTIELAEDHAMFAGMEKMKELIMKDAKSGVGNNDNYIQFDDGTWIDLDPSMKLNPAFDIKEGEKVKVYVFKED